MSRRLNLDLRGQLPAVVLLLGLGLDGGAASAANVVVQLRNGDRLTGTLIAQETNHIVISTSWAGSLALPISAVGGLTTAEGEALPLPPPPKPAPPPAPPQAAPAKPVPEPAAKAPPKSKLTTTVNIGTDLLFGSHDRQLYYSQVKTTYEQPYRSDPKKFFRTLAEYRADYGETDGVKSANRMGGSLKTDFDFAKRNYFYSVANAGYDEIRKIDIQYGGGPGLGHRLFTKPAFALNVELGGNYQVEERSAGEDKQNGYFRFAEDFKWKINNQLSLANKSEFYLNMEESGQYRFRLDSTLEYRFWKSLSLNLSLLDIYDSSPAPDVDQNELQIRSSLGVTF